MAATSSSRSQMVLFDQEPAAPALLSGEKRDDYNALHARIVEAVRPTDALEAIWVGDVVDLTFDINRLRRMQLRIIEAAKAEALERLVRPVQGGSDSHRFAKAFHNATVKQVDAALKGMALNHDHVMAKALEVRIAEVDKVNSMIAQAEDRRNRALREIDRHRDVLAARLRAAAEIEDAHFEVVEDGCAVTGGPANAEIPG
jgi:hypothetical protein